MSQSRTWSRQETLQVRYWTKYVFWGWKTVKETEPQKNKSIALSHSRYKHPRWEAKSTLSIENSSRILPFLQIALFLLCVSLNCGGKTVFTLNSEVIPHHLTWEIIPLQIALIIHPRDKPLKCVHSSFSCSLHRQLYSTLSLSFSSLRCTQNLPVTFSWITR